MLQFNIYIDTKNYNIISIEPNKYNLNFVMKKFHFLIKVMISNNIVPKNNICQVDLFRCEMEHFPGVILDCLIKSLLDVGNWLLLLFGVLFL